MSEHWLYGMVALGFVVRSDLARDGKTFIPHISKIGFSTSRLYRSVSAATILSTTSSRTLTDMML